MHGQGIANQNKFKHLITQHLAKAAGRRGSLTYDRSRSGAQIHATPDARRSFPNIYPELFNNAAEREAFFPGDPRKKPLWDETPATRLPPEIPATFPTITWQVSNLSPATGRTINVALVTGGANDIDFEDVLSPQNFPGEFIEKYDGLIRRIAHDDILELLGAVRAKCPNAVILLFGYHKPLSYESGTEAIKAFFKAETNTGDVAWFINEIFDVVPVDQMVREVRIRSEWAMGRAQHWMRQAVDDACRVASLRGPGILFVPPHWPDRLAAFTKNPYIWSEYRSPVHDEVAAERLSVIPREKFEQRLLNVLFAIAGAPGFDESPAAMRTLADKLSGPVDLQLLLDSVANDRDGRPAQAGRQDANLRLLTRELAAEIHRIRRARIASFLHPTDRAALRYDHVAVDRYGEHEALVDAVTRAEAAGQPESVPSPDGNGTLSGLLSRFGLRSSGSLLADLGHLWVDAITLVTVTRRESDPFLGPDISLIVHRDGKDAYEHRLNFPYHFIRGGPDVVKKFYPHFEPAVTNRFTVPLTEELRLDEITGMELVMGPDPAPSSKLVGAVWRPRRIELSINGRVVKDLTFARRELKPGERLPLTYPG
jgi:hypothetical protein